MTTCKYAIYLSYHKKFKLYYVLIYEQKCKILNQLLFYVAIICLTGFTYLLITIVGIIVIQYKSSQLYNDNETNNARIYKSLVRHIYKYNM